MHLRVDRHPTHLETTIGRLFVDDVPTMWTLEDAIRDHKIDGETAIPAGEYQVILVDSPHFGPDTLAIPNVHGFTDILIHNGNTKANTKGCLLVGRLVSADGSSIRESRLALARLKAQVVPRIKAGEPVTLDIRDPQ